MRRIAIAPARGGSKRIANKNIAQFCGRPIIGYILQAARESGLFDVIHVSTDSEAIADVARSLDFAPDFARTPELADDHTPIVPVLRWVLEQYAKRGQHFDEVCLLMPCAALVEPSDLIAAHNIFEGLQGTRPVLAVASYPVPVEWAFTRSPDGILEALDLKAQAMRSQDITPKFFDAGLFCFFGTAHLTGPREPGEIGFASSIVPRHKAIDIDTPEDWELAEQIAQSILR